MSKTRRPSSPKSSTTKINLIDPGYAELELAYAPYRERMLECFARFVIDEGYGAMTPRGETWQACGRRMFGEDRFNAALRAEIARRRQQDHTANPGGGDHAQTLQRDQRVSPSPESGHEVERGEDARGEDLRVDAQTS